MNCVNYSVPSPAAGTVRLSRYRCPYCDNGRWESGEKCLHCHGSGTTDDIAGYSPEEVVALPRPPAVMKSPCVDCAYRPGSPEEEDARRPGPDTAFFCHHGMLRQDQAEGTGYQPAAWAAGMPLGYMVCAGWWALATGHPLPEAAFRDPGGSDRSQAASTAAGQQAGGVA
jgi:hypothetical protein